MALTNANPEAFYVEACVNALQLLPTPVFAVSTAAPPEHVWRVARPPAGAVDTGWWSVTSQPPMSAVALQSCLCTVAQAASHVQAVTAASAAVEEACGDHRPGPIMQALAALLRDRLHAFNAAALRQAHRLAAAGHATEQTAAGGAAAVRARSLTHLLAWLKPWAAALTALRRLARLLRAPVSAAVDGVVAWARVAEQAAAAAATPSTSLPHAALEAALRPFHDALATVLASGSAPAGSGGGGEWRALVTASTAPQCLASLAPVLAATVADVAMLRGAAAAAGQVSRWCPPPAAAPRLAPGATDGGVASALRAVRRVVHARHVDASVRLMAFFREEVHVVAHLQLLRDVACCSTSASGSGVSLLPFTTKLFAALQSAGGLPAVQDSTVLTAWLRGAVEDTCALPPAARRATAPLLPLLSVTLAPAATVSAFLSTGIGLAYTPPWPLTVLVHPRAMATYNAVFRLALRTKYAKHVLDRTHHDARRQLSALMAAHRQVAPGHLPALRRQVHSLHLGLRSVMHFVNSLHAHVVHHVTFAGWEALADTLRHPATTLRRAVAAHNAFLRNLSRLLLLSDAAATRELHALLDAALAFADKYAAFFDLAARAVAAFAEVYPADGADDDLPGLLAAARGGSAAAASVTGSLGTTTLAEASSIVLCSALEDRVAAACTAAAAHVQRFNKVLGMCVAVLRAKVSTSGASHLAAIVDTLTWNGFVKA